MLDHNILTVSDVKRSLKFYTAAPESLKITNVQAPQRANGHPDLGGLAMAKKTPFRLKQGKPNPASIHWGFIAENNKAVDSSYKTAIAVGAKDHHLAPCSSRILSRLLRRGRV